MPNQRKSKSSETKFGAYLGLGSNLNQPIDQLEKTLIRLQQSKKIELESYSSIYQTPPFDKSSQPDYYNLVLKITTTLQPIELINYLKLIEKEQGRKSAKKWSSRIIDIDILLFNNMIFNSSNLTIPHQSLVERNFFLKPLIEITAIDCKFAGIGYLKPHLDKINTPIKKVKSIEEITNAIGNQTKNLTKIKPLDGL